MNSVQTGKTGKERRATEETAERQELAKGRDSFVYAFAGDRVVRVARKGWAALYAHASV